MRRRTVRWLVATPVILLTVTLIWGLLDSSGGVSGRTQWNMRWNSAEETELGGYLITPSQARRYASSPATGTVIPARPSADGRYPAVLLLHEWWGLNAETVSMADQLSADGYVVLAPDLFRGRVSVSRPGAVLQMIRTPRAQVEDDVDRALTQLRAMPTVDPQRVGVLGFCFGGTQAMLLGSRTADLGATAIFYGGSPITTDDEIGALGARGPVVGIYGGEDSTISVDDVRRFEELLSQRGRETFFTVYPDAGHAFVDPRSLRRGGDAAAAWDQVRQLLQQYL